MSLLHSCRRTVPALALALSLSSTLPVLADPVAPPATPAADSSHWAAVSPHLQLGGPFLAYADIDGDITKLAQVADGLVEQFRSSQPALQSGVKMEPLMEALGFSRLKAVGLSSRRITPALYHNRALLYMPEGPAGLFRLPGGKPSPAVISALAPADTDFALQIELALSSLVPTVRSVLTATGDKENLNRLETMLKFPVPGVSMNAGAALEKLDLRLMFIGSVTEGKTIPVPGTQLEIPAFRFMLAIDGADFLMEPLLTYAGAYDSLSIEKGDGFTTIQPNQGLPAGLEKHFQPALYFDHKTKRVFLSSHLEYVRTALTGETHLQDQAEYKTLTGGLAAECNGLSYSSPRFYQAARTFMSAAAQAGAPGKKDQGDTYLRTLESLEGLMGSASGGTASTWSLLPEGWLILSNAPATHKTSIAGIALAPLTAAGMLGNSQNLRELNARGAGKSTKEKSRPQDDEEDDEPAEIPSKVIRANLRQIAYGAQNWFLENPTEPEVSYPRLVDAEMVYDVDSVAGEKYKSLTLLRRGGTLSVKTASGDTISYTYPAVTD